MSDSNLSSVMQHRGNFTSKANFPKKSEASGEPRKTTENCYDFGIRSFPDTNKLYLSRNCFAKKLKVLSPSVCHCGLCHKFYFCLKNVSASTKSTSKIHQGKSLSVTFQVFKLAFLLLTLSKTVSTSSLRKTEVVSSSTFQNFDIRPSDDAHASLPVANRQLDSAAKSENALARILSRRKRSTSCKENYSEILKLVDYAHGVAREAKNANSRRRRNSNNQMRARCHADHIKIKGLLCEVNARPSLFNKGNSNIKSTLQSLLILLQKEMNRLRKNFVEFNNESCITKLPRESNDAVERYIRNHLFRMRSEMLNVCTKIDNNSRK